MNFKSVKLYRFDSRPEYFKLKSFDRNIEAFFLFPNSEFPEELVII